jgi:hypothetical protein
MVQSKSKATQLGIQLLRDGDSRSIPRVLVQNSSSHFGRVAFGFDAHLFVGLLPCDIKYKIGWWNLLYSPHLFVQKKSLLLSSSCIMTPWANVWHSPSWRMVDHPSTTVPIVNPSTPQSPNGALPSDSNVKLASASVIESVHLCAYSMVQSHPFGLDERVGWATHLEYI